MVEDEKMTFERAPSEKHGDGTVDTVVHEPPNEANGRKSLKRVSTSMEVRIEIQRIVDNFGQEGECENDDHDMVVQCLPQASSRKQMIEKIECARERGYFNEKNSPKLNLPGRNQVVARRGVRICTIRRFA